MSSILGAISRDLPEFGARIRTYRVINVIEVDIYSRVSI